MREQGYSRLQNDPDAQQQQQQQHRGGKQGQCPTWIRAFSILLLAACVACGLVIPIVVLFAGASSLPNQMSSQRLMVHLTRLENVAAANGGSRAPWTGYNASLAYVEKVAFFCSFFEEKKKFTFFFLGIEGQYQLDCEAFPVFFCCL